MIARGGEKERRDEGGKKRGKKTRNEKGTQAGRARERRKGERRRKRVSGKETESK